VILLMFNSSFGILILPSITAPRETLPEINSPLNDSFVSFIWK